MAVDIHQLIAAINPDVFCDEALRGEVKRILKEGFQRHDKLVYANAAAKARAVEANRVSVKTLELENPFSLPGYKSPNERHALVYDSLDESMEAFYFWILDELTAAGWHVTKVLDSFGPTPGSGLSAEMGQRGMRAQQQAARMIQEIHHMVTDILRAAAAHYIHSYEVESPLSTNRSRSEVESSLLRSKLETIKLYVRWLGPYLKQAGQLKQMAQNGAALPNLFNSVAFEMILLAQREYPVEEDVNRAELPKMFLKGRQRKYYPTLISELKMRSAPERVSGGGFAHRGQMEVVLSSYALNEEELSLVHEEIERDDLREVMGFVLGKGNGALTEILNKLEALIFGPEEKEPKPDDPNPFVALFDFKGTFGAPDPAKATAQPGASVKSIRADSDFEKVIRSQAILEARRRCLEFYEQCKERLNMAVWDDHLQT